MPADNDPENLIKHVQALEREVRLLREGMFHLLNMHTDVLLAATTHDPSLRAEAFASIRKNIEIMGNIVVSSREIGNVNERN